MPEHRFARSAATIALMAWMVSAATGCTSTPVLEAEASNVPVPSPFPDPEKAWEKSGRFPNLDNLRAVREGMNKDQIYDLIGRPHFDEGMFGEREWNYLFHLPDGRGGYRLCQYQLHFDDAMRIDGRYWQEDTCARLLDPDDMRAMEVTLDVDTLFDIDSAVLSSYGHQRVAELAARIQQSIQSPSIVVVGHADRLGSAQYNQTLSSRRAMTVRRALIDRGISLHAISAQGVGESAPVKQCSNRASVEAQKACLSSNRRVEIKVTGKTIRPVI